MLATKDDCLAILRCPKTAAPLRKHTDHELVAAAPDHPHPPRYRIVNDLPVVVDFANSVLEEESTHQRAGASVVARRAYGGPAGVVKRLLSPPKASTRRNVAALISDLENRQSPAKVLVIGGGSVGQGMEPLYDHEALKIFAFDIYASPLVQVVADAHAIPMGDDVFDAVVIQAVLEHTIEPRRVVDEIWRVLKPDGLVYAETPFMQQVHEGAYDFTRFSESGHRYLFRRFERIDSGANGGPGQQFMWSADYLFRSVFRSRAAGKIAKLACFWAQYLDNLIPEAYAIDGASGVFFYGRKSQTAISPLEAVAHYKGAQ